MTNRALVLFSGGQDSTTCLAWALKNFSHVETLGFDYGQRHRVELEARKVILSELRQAFQDWADRLGQDHSLETPSLAAVGDTALTSDVEIKMNESGLPNTFVPGRNLFFLTLAGALAYRRDLGVIVGGMCETDYSGYPDCRRSTLDAQEQALSLGLDRPVRIDTPLMYLDKAATWAMAHDLGGDALINLIREESHTCYLGVRDRKHDWGRGCGSCPACELRAKGYAEWMAGQVRA